MNKLILFIIGFCIFFYFLGIGGFETKKHPYVCECRVCLGIDPPEPYFHHFKLMGEMGGLHKMIVFLWLIDFFWFVHSGWDSMWGVSWRNQHMLISGILLIILTFLAFIIGGSG